MSAAASSRARARALARALGLAFAFLTRLPVPDITPQGRDLGRSMALHPLVGLVLGALLWGLSALLPPGLPAELEAAVLLGVLALLTGGLHLDGLADCFDGMGVVAQDRERRLAVMRDPRAGALGVAGLVACYAVKLTALAALLAADEAALLLPALALARWAAVALAVALPHARREGTGRALAEKAGRIEVLLGGSIVVAALVAVGEPSAGWGVGGAALLAGGLAAHMNRLLGGLTGDVYGAAVEASEIGFFLGIACAIGAIS